VRNHTVAIILFLLGSALAACGRIPPLDDAAVPITPDAPVRFRDAAPDAPIVCNQVKLSTAEHVLADVLLLLDRSGSMRYNISRNCSCDPNANPQVVCADLQNCVTRWATLGAALDVTLSSAPSLHWGLKVFSSPNAGSCGVNPGVDVPIAAGTTAAIRALIDGITPEGDTPTAAAIVAATTYLATLSDSNSKGILLATDGDPNCAAVASPSAFDLDVEGTISAIAQARDAGFLVYVVGMGLVANLETFAQAGGTGSYYPGQSPDQIAQALATISKAASCTFTVVSTPSDPTSVGVYLDKTIVPKNANDGWTFGASASTVVLHGGFCDRTLSDPTKVVQVLFLGCDESFPTTLP